MGNLVKEKPMMNNTKTPVHRNWLARPPLCVRWIQASLLEDKRKKKKKKKKCLIITFVDLCTFWLPPLLGTRHGHSWARPCSRADAARRQLPGLREGKKQVRPKGDGKVPHSPGQGPRRTLFRERVQEMTPTSSVWSRFSPASHGWCHLGQKHPGYGSVPHQAPSSWEVIMGKGFLPRA